MQHALSRARQALSDGESEPRLSGFSQRLRSERSRLGLTQAEFAALGGVKLGSQHGYESGKQRPSVDYLIRLAGSAMDIDVSYIVAGERSGDALSVDAAELIEILQSLPLETRGMLLEIARTLSKPQSSGSTVHETRATYKAAPKKRKPPPTKPAG